METAAIGRMFTAKHGGRLDANQEFLALAASNLAAGLGRGFPVSGGMSQSLVNEGGGARTPLSGAFAAGIILVVVLFFSHLLAALPQPVLAAVVLVAVAGLFKVSTLKHLWRGDRPEFLVAMAAIVGVLGQGLLRGVMIGAIISLVLLIRRASRPHVAFLGRIAGTRRFSDRERHPDNELIPGVLIFRPESGLLYFNMDHVRDTIVERVARRSHAAEARRAGPFRCALRGHARAHMLAELGRRTHRRRHPRAGGRGALLGARSFAQRRGGRETRRDQPVHLRGRRGGGISKAHHDLKPSMQQPTLRPAMERRPSKCAGAGIGDSHDDGIDPDHGLGNPHRLCPRRRHAGRACRRAQHFVAVLDEIARRAPNPLAHRLAAR